MDVDNRQPVTADASTILYNRYGQNKKLNIYNEPKNAYGTKQERTSASLRRQRILTKFAKIRTKMSPEATPEKDSVSRTQSQDVTNEGPEMLKVRIIDGKNKVLKPYLNSIDHMSKQVQNLKFKNIKLRQSLQSTPTKRRFKSEVGEAGPEPQSILRNK